MHFSSSRVRALRAATAGAIVLASLLLALTAGAGRAMAAPTPADRIEWAEQQWFLSGASLPYVNRRCDFGCRQRGGVIANTARVDRHFRSLSRNGVKMVRWYLFPDDAWQVRRAADGMPSMLRENSVFPDMDRAVQLAARHDVYIMFVLFSDTRTVPVSWMSNAAQRQRLASLLAPMFSRYSRSSNVIAWELFDEPERGIDEGAVAAADVQETVRTLAQTVHAGGRSLVTVGSQSVDRLPLWRGLGLDFYAPHWYSADSSGPRCAGCTDVATLASTLDVDLPVVIGATDANGATAAESRLRSLRRRGYAGALLYSTLRKTHPSVAGNPKVPLQAPWRFIYRLADVGPRARPLNPCLGPKAGSLRCPDLRMSRPSNLTMLGSKLLSRNSLNSYGSGPAELFARRSGRFSMDAVQKIWKRRGGKLTVDTDAQVSFKAIPGQYRYWKWRNAATMELWRLDGAGRPIRLVRRGPKTVYCLRDLRRTRSMRRSPRGRYYPGCSQNLRQRRVTLGTSVGWSDIYPASYHENWIDVRNLRGCFAYVHVADPTNVIYESNETNNTSQVTVRLPFNGSNAGCPNARPLRPVSDRGGY